MGCPLLARGTLSISLRRKDNAKRYLRTVRFLYNAREEVKERKKEHNLLPKSRASREAYNNSPRGKEAKAKSDIKIRERVTGWTQELFIKALVEQNNSCAICKKEFTRDTKNNTPHVDHEHSTPPKPRALLCSNCNIAIGMLGDDAKLCEEAAAYLRKWDQKNVVLLSL